MTKDAVTRKRTDIEPAGIVPLEIRNAVMHFTYRDPDTRKRAEVHALDGVSISVREGETVGLVGESGCGKSTLGRIAAGLLRADSGFVRVLARPQSVFQDASASLDPRWTIGSSIAEPIASMPRGARRKAVSMMLDLVGLSSDAGGRFPHELSGGQQQRACIARALVSGTRLVVLDECLSALDVSIQAQILHLLVDLQETLGVAYLFISHDLTVVNAISHRVVVLYLGQVVENATAADFRSRPLHPYSYALASASLVPDPVIERKRKHVILSGDLPSAIQPPSGCRFRSRCPFAQDICAEVEPPLIDHGGGHLAACHFPGVADSGGWDRQISRPVRGDLSA